MRRKMKVFICDDDEQVCKILENKISKKYKEVHIKKFHSGKELLKEKDFADVILLDIEMDGINGIETAGKIREISPKVIIIFITAKPEYVFQAFDVEAFHYLVKPFSNEKFYSVMDKVLSKLKNDTVAEEKDKKEFIMIHYGGVHEKIYLEDIIYAEVINRIVIIHKSNTDVQYYGKLAELEKMLGSGFFRTHRSYLVNFKHIVRYDSGMVTMKKGTALMAKANYSAFVKAFLKYNARNGGLHEF